MAYYQKDNQKGFKSFTQDMKKNSLPRILILHGQEQFLVEWAYERLVSKYVQKGWEQLDSVILADEIDPEMIMKNLETVSMISPKRIVWVKEYKHFLGEKSKGYSKDELDQLAKDLNAYDDANMIIFSFDDMSKEGPHIKNLDASNCAKYHFDRLSPPELSSFITKQFAANGIKIPSDKVKMIIDSSGYYNKDSDYRLYNMVNDIKKIVAHCEDKQVTENDIAECTSGDMDSYIFDFIDALGKGNREQAFVVLNNLLIGGGNAFQVVSLLANQFELMVQIKELKDAGLRLDAITKELNVHEFRVKKALELANKFDLAKLKELLLNIYESDIEIKLGNIDQKTVLELLVAKI